MIKASRSCDEGNERERESKSELSGYGNGAIMRAKK